MPFLLLIKYFLEGNLSLKAHQCTEGSTQSKSNTLRCIGSFQIIVNNINFTIVIIKPNKLGCSASTSSSFSPSENHQDRHHPIHSDVLVAWKSTNMLETFKLKSNPGEFFPLLKNDRLYQHYFHNWHFCRRMWYDSSRCDETKIFIDIDTAEFMFISYTYRIHVNFLSNHNFCC